MKLVSSLAEIEQNAFLLADILDSDRKERSAAAALIGKGRAFFPFYHSKKLAFAPSRFIGYKNNSISLHIKRRAVSDGRITNRAIDSILGFKYIEDSVLHKELKAYARRIGVDLEDRKHRFWPLQSVQRYANGRTSALDDIDDDLGNDDPDYQRAMRGAYKRDPAVRKAVLKRADGECEYCGSTTFMMKDGRSYLETHHIIALSKQGPDRIGNVIALCANHHREAHFSKDWKALQEKFSELLEQKAAV